MNQTAERNIFLRETLMVLFKHKWVILWFTVIVFAVVFVGNYVIPPTYESVSKVRLMRGREVMQTDPSVTKNAAMPVVALSLEDVNSEVDLIKSSRVLEQVVAGLGLDEGVSVRQGVLRRVARVGKQAGLEILYALQLKQRPTRIQHALSELDEAIKVERIPDSHVLEVKVQAGDPELARKINEKLLEVYTQEHIELFSNPETLAFFQEQLDRVAKELQEAQAALERFVNEHALISMADEKNLLLQQYTELHRLLTQLEETEVVTQGDVEGSGEAPLIELLSRDVESIVVRELQLRLLELMLARNRLTETAGRENLDVLAKNREIEKAAARLREAISVTKGVAQRKLTQLETRLKQLNELNPMLEALSRDVKIKSDAYEYYADKLEESRVLDAMTSAQITSTKITSAPTTPVNPIRPKKLLNLALALAAGVVGGIGLAMVIEYLNHGLRTPEEVEHFLGVPMLTAFFRRFSKNQEHGEALRLAALLDTMKPKSPRVVQIGSSVRGESGRRIAEALAAAYAGDLASTTVLVDLSSEDGKGQPKAGLSELLLGEATVEDVAETRAGLAVIRRGRSELPSHAFTSGRFAAILDDLRQRYERIVVYVDPVLASHEVLKSAPYADGHVLVTRADSTRREVVQRAIEGIREAGGNVLGVVLTDRRQYIPQFVYRRI